MVIDLDSKPGWRQASALVLCLSAPVVVGSACTPTFAPASVITRPRVIAVITEPPEATPGQQVTHTPIVADVGGALAPDAFAAGWWRCPDSDSDGLGDLWECKVPAERKDLGDGVPYTDTVPANLFGTAPAQGEAVDPSTSPPEKILGAILGYWRIVGMTMTAGDERMESFKRVPVFPPFPLALIDERLAAIDVHVDENGVLAPNTNPVINAVTVHDGAVSGPTVTSVKRGKTYFFVPRIDDRQLEAYYGLQVDLDGLDVTDRTALAAIKPDELLLRFKRRQRCEVPVYNWFVTAGHLRNEITVDEGVIARVYDERGVDCPAIEGELRNPEANFTVPTGDDEADPLPADGVVHAWVVMRDGRGGTAVRSFDLPID